MIHLDTHVALWLYTGDLEKMSPAAAQRIADDELVVSPMVELELQYLFEIGRTRGPGRDVIEELTARLGVRPSEASFGGVARRATTLGWTRDPFDRLIVATAMADGCALLTRDETIRRHFDGAIW